MNLPVAHAVDEGLRAVFGPDVLVVERAGVPHDFVHQWRGSQLVDLEQTQNRSLLILGHLDWMGAWAWPRGFERTTAWVGHVGLVVRAVEILSIPASGWPLSTDLAFSPEASNLRWEGDGRSDSTAALLLGQARGVVTCARCTTEWVLLDVCFAAMAQLLLHAFACPEHGVSDNHTEALPSCQFPPFHRRTTSMALTGLKAVAFVLPSYGEL
jgi:hypothetical protein